MSSELEDGVGIPKVGKMARPGNRPRVWGAEATGNGDGQPPAPVAQAPKKN